MADTVKISELVELVSGSVLGTTIVPVVSGGTTQKVQMSSVKAYVNSDVVTDSELSTQISAVNSTIDALTTDEISEGSNLYYTNARVQEVLYALSLSSGSESTLSVTDGGTSISSVDSITFSGATVTGTEGSATVTISNTSVLNVNDGNTSVDTVDTITFSGATVSNDGGGNVTVTIDAAEASTDSVAMMIHTASLNTYTSSVNDTLDSIDAHILNIATYTSSIETHIVDISTFTSSFSESVDGRLVTLEAGGASIPDGTVSSSQQITDFGFISSSSDIEETVVIRSGGAGIAITSASADGILSIAIINTAGAGGGDGVAWPSGYHIISQSTTTGESNANLATMYIDSTDTVTFEIFSSSVDSRFGGGGGADYISNVSFANNTLAFTGTGFGFNGNVTLSDGLVSSSNQITDLGFLNDGDITAVYLATKLPQGIVSGAQQITDLGFAGGGTGLISSSAQVILTQSDSSSFTTYFIPEETNLYYTDARVKTKLDIEGVFSSSEQISLGVGLISSSAQVNYAEVYNELELRSGSNAILITSGTAGYGNPYITIGLDGTAFASAQTEIDFGLLSTAFYGETIPSTSAQLFALGAVTTAELNTSLDSLNGFTGSLGTFGVTSASLASRIDTIGSVGFEIETGFQLISQSNSISNLILSLVRVDDTTGDTFSQFSASVAANIAAGSPTTLADLTDTSFTSLGGGELLKYNVTTDVWENTFQLNGDYTITGSLFVTGSGTSITADSIVVNGIVTADSFVAGDVGTPVIDSSTSLDLIASAEVTITSLGEGVVIKDILVLNPITGSAPVTALSGSIMASGSDGSFKPYFWDGNSWREISLV